MSEPTDEEEIGETLELSLGSVARSAAIPGLLGTLGRFEVLGELGAGGMGRVIEARDPDLMRNVALKVVARPDNLSDEQLGRFVAEAQITSQLEHPNIVPIHEMGSAEEGLPFFVMKKVAGRSLAELIEGLRRGREELVAGWSRHRLLNAFVQVCNAVAYAHDRGVLHRDLKPANIMVGEFGEVLVMDWGVAVLASEMNSAVRITASTGGEDEVPRGAVGTPGYMSPEQATGEVHGLDLRTDVWSLGAILYELLTYRKAYRGGSVYAIMHQAMGGPPIDPREQPVGSPVPDEIAEICLKALATEREQRFDSASDLAAAVEAFLEGSLRRKRAAERVGEAEALWEKVVEIRDAVRNAASRKRELEAQVEPWTPLGEKTTLLDATEHLAELRAERVRRFERVVSACEQALREDPGSGDARVLLARAWWGRLEEAEARGDAEEVLHCEARVEAYDDGKYGTLLRGVGSVVLGTEPSGVQVRCQDIEKRGLVWELGEAQPLGETPVEEHPLEMGSYLLTLHAEGSEEVLYPVCIHRGTRWGESEVPVDLPPRGAVPEGFAYVPAGPFLSGGTPANLGRRSTESKSLPGFLIGLRHVTVREYLEFLSALHAQDPDGAWARVPRQQSGRETARGQYLARPEPDQPYLLPTADRDGDSWSGEWPVFGVSWHDALAYAAWQAERTGLALRLPLELELEKAGRGVDGRFFPWGDRFDATLCSMRVSTPGRPQPRDSCSFPADRSVYGVWDLAGSARDWCGDTSFDGDPSMRAVRGGSWLSLERDCHLAARGATDPWFVASDYGFRLALDPPWRNS